MLMYGKEARNLKPAGTTLFRTKGQKKSIVEMFITGYAMSTSSIAFLNF